MKMKALCLIKTQGKTKPVTQCHISEDMNHQFASSSSFVKLAHIFRICWDR